MGRGCSPELQKKWSGSQIFELSTVSNGNLPAGLDIITGPKILHGFHNIHTLFFFLKLIWLCQVLVTALRIFHLCYGVWNGHVGSSSLIREPGPPELGVQSLSHWTTGEVPYSFHLAKYHVLPIQPFSLGCAKENWR